METKYGKLNTTEGLLVAKKKGSYCILFLMWEGITVQIPLPEDRSATYMYQFYRDVILRKFKKYHY